MQVLKKITVEEEVLGVFDCSTLTVRAVNDDFKKGRTIRRMRVWCIWPGPLA